MAVVVLAGIAALVTHYLYGGLRVGGQRGARRAPRGPRACTWRSSRRVLMLLIAANYWLDRYSILDEDGPRSSPAPRTPT